MVKYDGWTLKNIAGRNPWLIPCYFTEKRKGVINCFETIFGIGAWRRHRDRGEFKIVKVKLVEVE